MGEKSVGIVNRDWKRKTVNRNFNMHLCSQTRFVHTCIFLKISLWGWGWRELFIWVFLFILGKEWESYRLLTLAVFADGVVARAEKENEFVLGGYLVNLILRKDNILVKNIHKMMRSPSFNHHSSATTCGPVESNLIFVFRLFLCLFVRVLSPIDCFKQQTLAI